MKKFLLKSFIFSIPVLIYLVISYNLIYKIREHLPLVSIIGKQQKSKQESYYNRLLFGNVLDIYKYNTMLHKQPEALVLGQSIVLCFRDFFVTPYDKSFYNTGLMIRNVSDLENITEQLLDGTLKKPKYIIFGLDHSFVLNNVYLDEISLKTSLWKDSYFDSKKHLRAMQDVILKSDVREVPSIDMGYGKRGMAGNGYRRDGSCRNKWEIDLFTNDSTHIEGPLKDDFDAHKNGYPFPMEYSNEKSVRLTNCLKKLKENNIELLIYIPVLSDEFFEYAMQFDYVKNFWAKYSDYQNYLIDQGFNVITFTTPSQFGLTDYYMLSSDHPGEVFVAKQFLKFYQDKNHLGPVSSQFDLKQLEDKIHNTKHPLSLEVE